MISVWVWACEHCGRIFLNSQEARKHEAEHYGLSAEEFQKWHLLYVDTDDAYRYSNAPSHDLKCIAAKQRLDKFEKAHNLTKKRKPLDWIDDN